MASISATAPLHYLLLDDNALDTVQEKEFHATHEVAMTVDVLFSDGRVPERMHEVTGVFWRFGGSNQVAIESEINQQAQNLAISQIRCMHIQSIGPVRLTCH